MSKLCSDAGFLKEIGKVQFFITIEKESEVIKTACREYTQLRNLKTSRPRGWIRSNTKIGPVLDVKICPHEGRYCVDIMIESLFIDKTVSWIRIVNGNNKYVTDTSQEIPIKSVRMFIGTGGYVAKAKPPPKPALTLSPVSIPYHERKWIDIDPEPFNACCFAVSKFMIRLLRHDKIIPREDDGAVRFDDIIEKSR